MEGSGPAAPSDNAAAAAAGWLSSLDNPGLPGSTSLDFLIDIYLAHYPGIPSKARKS
jgi:hypothetical protein